MTLLGPTRRALAHEGLIADDRARADVRAGEDDRPRADRGALLDDEGVELGARRARGRRQPRRLAEHDVVLDDDAVADDHAVVDDDVGAEADIAADGGGGAENETGGGVIGHGGYPSGAVPSPDSTRPLRGAVLGLGMIGRHHARLLQASPRVAFVGAVDPGGDRFGAVHEPGLVFGDLDALLRAGAPDFAIVAVPTEEHVAAVSTLAAEGVHVLVEKPLAATAAEGRVLIDACRAAGIHAAVGHVERFNPALLELREKTQAGELGQVFLVATERIGPFPDRVRDVGVIKDLATHDLDLVRWLGGAPVERVSGRDPAPDGPRARGPPARHRAPGERDQLQLRRRLAVAHQGPPDAGSWASAGCWWPTR